MFPLLHLEKGALPCLQALYTGSQKNAVTAVACVVNDEWLLTSACDKSLPLAVKLPCLVKTAGCIP